MDQRAGWKYWRIRYGGFDMNEPKSWWEIMEDDEKNRCQSLEEVVSLLNEQKIIYSTCSRILDEFPHGSRHKAAKKLNKTMDQALEAIEELENLRWSHISPKDLARPMLTKEGMKAIYGEEEGTENEKESR